MPPKRRPRKSTSPGGQLPVYFSHSYRYEDRELNEFFWNLFWDAGFTFSIDPKSTLMSYPYLQALIKRSPGFAAAITSRSEQENGCSPFMLYEYAIALLARKPKLIFVEKGLPEKYFPKGDPDIVKFDRYGLEGDRDDFKAQIQKFMKRAEPYRRLGTETGTKFGILLDPGHPDYPQALLDRIKALIDKSNFAPEFATFGNPDGVQVTVKFDQYDFVILDVRPGVLPDWVYPYVQGRLIPSIRLFYTAEERPELPLFVQSQFMRGVATDDEPVLFWQDPEQLIKKIETHLSKMKRLNEPSKNRPYFADKDSGLKYFRSAGRRHELKIFLSNASDANTLARPLSRELTAYGIKNFQYKESSTIPLGTKWKPGLDETVRKSELFLVLLTGKYFKSGPSQGELKTALEKASRGQATVIPYLLHQTVQGMEDLPQGRDLTGLSTEDQIARIRDDVDELLRTDAIADVTPPPDDFRPVDVAFLTILKEEYAAVHHYLEGARPAPVRDDAPISYLSSLGEITSPTYPNSYRAVLTFAGDPGNPNAVSATRDTIERWKPRYLVVVGIAGGVAQDLAKGDVVVTKVVWNYEYGKLAGDFKPRHDFTYITDSLLANSAELFAVEEPGWSSGIDAKPPSGQDHQPSVRVGAVASGDKVVDNIAHPLFQAVLKEWPKVLAVEMEGAGAALAVKKAMEEGKTVGFGMIRGISDLPSQATDASAQTQERDAWKKYASEAAACLAVNLVKRRWPVKPRESS
jgi:nucleoside phosphorylase